VRFRPAGQEELADSKVRFKPAGQEELADSKVRFKPAGQEELAGPKVRFRPAGQEGGARRLQGQGRPEFPDCQAAPSFESKLLV
jgi:hypothetical protein